MTDTTGVPDAASTYDPIGNMTGLVADEGRLARTDRTDATGTLDVILDTTHRGG